MILGTVFSTKNTIPWVNSEVKPSFLIFIRKLEGRAVAVLT